MDGYNKMDNIKANRLSLNSDAYARDAAEATAGTEDQKPDSLAWFDVVVDKIDLEDWTCHTSYNNSTEHKDHLTPTAAIKNENTTSQNIPPRDIILRCILEEGEIQPALAEESVEYLDESLDNDHIDRTILTEPNSDPNQVILDPALCRRLKKIHKCTRCGKGYSHTGSLQRHKCKGLIKKSSGKTYRCRKCGEKFATRDDCEAHKPSHTYKTPFTCDFCGQSYGCRTDIIRHLNSHIDLRPQCNICHMRFPSNSVLYKHLMKGHSAPSAPVSLHCKVCQKVLHSRLNLQRHEMTHFGGKFECDFCSSFFVQKAQLINHICFHHLGIKRFSCDECSKSYTTNLNLKYHKMKHENKFLHECGICGKKSVHPRVHTYHMKTHAGFQCKYCVNTYSKNSDLVKHEATHQPQNNAMPKRLQIANGVEEKILPVYHQPASYLFQCSMCQDGFDDQILFRRHMIIKHRTVLNK